jgi:hypothetical protein
VHATEPESAAGNAAAAMRRTGGTKRTSERKLLKNKQQYGNLGIELRFLVD